MFKSKAEESVVADVPLSTLYRKLGIKDMVLEED